MILTRTENEMKELTLRQNEIRFIAVITIYINKWIQTDECLWMFTEFRCLAASCGMKLGLGLLDLMLLDKNI